MIKDYEIPLPRWELSDPFGRAALRSLRFELKKALCERDGYKEERNEILKAQKGAIEGLMDTIRREQKATDEARSRFDLAEKARGDIARKNNQLRDEIDKLIGERAKLRIELERMKEEYAQLQEDHEKLLRLTTDKEEEI